MNWSEVSFIEYLKAVDDTLEAFYERTSIPEEFEAIAEAHQQNIPPETLALRLGVETHTVSPEQRPDAG